MENLAAIYSSQLAERYGPTFFVIITAALALCATLLVTLGYSQASRDEKEVYDIGGSSIRSTWAFYKRRFDFIRENFRKTGEAMFKFRIGHYRAVALRGEEARVFFFNERRFNSTRAYRILLGSAPDINDINLEVEETSAMMFNKRLLTLMHKNRVADVLPALFDDLQNRMNGWGTEGKIDPFQDVYNLVFQMTVRMATCQELANDPVIVKHLSELYTTIKHTATTPFTLLFPWFPSSTRRTKNTATRQLFQLLSGYIKMRRDSLTPSSDAVDMFIGQGEDDTAIVEFIMGMIFAGVINTGVTSCWVLIFLASNPEWKNKVTAEVSSLISATNPSDPLHKRLSSVPISAWEDQMPALEAMIRETLRATKSGTVLRLNAEKDIVLGGKTIEKGSFVVYNVGDVHLDPDIYPEPYKFDPDRFSPEREEDKKAPFSFLGWGAGRHPCSGMRIAKLEIKMIVAMFLSGYEYSLVDGAGKFPNPFPQPDRNNIHQTRLPGAPCYLKYKKIVG